MLHRLALAVSVPFIIAGYGWLYTSELFLASNAHPALAARVVLFLVGIWAAVFLLHGLLLPWIERRREPAVAAKRLVASAVKKGLVVPVEPPRKGWRLIKGNRKVQLSAAASIRENVRRTQRTRQAGNGGTVDTAPSPPAPPDGPADGLPPMPVRPRGAIPR